MAILGMLLVGIGWLTAAVGGIWILVLAFQKSVVWGLGCFFVPFVVIIFAIQNWGEAKRPFLIQIGGIALAMLGMAIAAAGGGDTTAG